MSLKKIEQVKSDKGFRIWDLIIYGTVVILAVVLIIVFVLTRNTDPLTGVAISVRGETVFEYEFGSEPNIISDSIEVKEDSEGITVTVSDDGGGFNVIYINKSAKTAEMKEANCKGRQCLYFSAIHNNRGYILCDPHGIKIEPLYKEFDILM